MPAKGTSFWVFAFGYTILVSGLLWTGFDYYGRWAWSYPQNMGIVLGDGAIVLLGLSLTVVAEAIRRLEKHLGLPSR